MTEAEIVGGGDNGAERLSNSQIEAQAGAYDPALHGGDGGVSEAEWNNLPGWRKGALHRMATRRGEANERAARAEGAVEQMRKELAEAKALMQANHAKAAEPKPKGWDAIDTDKLEQFVRKAKETMHLYSLDRDNETLKAQAASIDPALLLDGERELAKRDAGASVAEKEKTWAATRQSEQAAAALQMRLRNDFGDDVFNPKSALMRAAVEEFNANADDKALFGETAAVYRAVERAAKRLNGTQRAMRDDERARLQIEGGIRREASPLNEIEALRAKGDWKSRGQAVDKSLELFLDQFSQI